MTDTHHVIPHANRPIFQWQEWYTFQWQPTGANAGNYTLTFVKKNGERLSEKIFKDGGSANFYGKLPVVEH